MNQNLNSGHKTGDSLGSSSLRLDDVLGAEWMDDIRAAQQVLGFVVLSQLSQLKHLKVTSFGGGGANLQGWTGSLGVGEQMGGKV